MMENTAPIAAANALLRTLSDEETAVEQLNQSFLDQLTALRTRNIEEMDRATQQTGAVVHTLSRLQQMRERQAHLLGRMMGLTEEKPPILVLVQQLNTLPDGSHSATLLQAARNRIREASSRAERTRDELEFALRFAVRLGRDMLRSIQGAPGPRAAGYTAGGERPEAPAEHSLMNQVA